MKKTIGIIGGMGPMATVDLYEKITAHTLANTDQEHIHVLIDSNAATPDRTEAILRGGPSPLPSLLRSAERLAAAGADFLIIPCNTSHHFIEDIRAASPIPVMSMIEQTAAYIVSHGYRKAILLGTEGCLRVGVYQSVLEPYGVEAIVPDEAMQREVMDVVYRGIKADAPTWDVSRLNEMLAELEGETDAVSVLACTELPLAVCRYGLRGTFVDPTLVLALAAIREAGYPTKE